MSTRVSTGQAVIDFQPLLLSEVQAAVRTRSAAQLSLSTPGGAAVQAWVSSGAVADAGSISSALAAGMARSSNRAVREAAATASAMAGGMASVCTVSGVGAAFAPLCGAVGGAVGVVAGAVTARHNARVQSASALWAAWWGATAALQSGIVAIRRAYSQAGMGALSDEAAACLLVDAMRARGSALTDRIWGPFRTRGYNAPCGIPGRICTDAYGTMQSAQGYRPPPALPPGEAYPPYFVMEKWWMLKGDGKYGDCVNVGDIKPNAAYQDKTSTRRERATRLSELANQIEDAVLVVIAAMINLKDQRSREVIDLAAAAAAALKAIKSQIYGDSIAESMAKARTAGQAQAQSYGDFLLAVTAELRACGVPEAELKKVTDQAWRDAALATCRGRKRTRTIVAIAAAAAVVGLAAGGTYLYLNR